MFTDSPGGGVPLRQWPNHMASDLAGDTLKPCLWMARYAHATAVSMMFKVSYQQRPPAKTKVSSV